LLYLLVTQDVSAGFCSTWDEAPIFVELSGMSRNMKTP
jgi:hypothetical protein